MCEQRLIKNYWKFMKSFSFIWKLNKRPFGYNKAIFVIEWPFGDQQSNLFGIFLSTLNNKEQFKQRPDWLSL